MNTSPTQHKVQLELSEPLYRWFSQAAQQRAQDIAEVIQVALEYYVQHFDITQTRTWELCGAFTVAEPEAAYQGEDHAKTNYAEHVDEMLYGDSHGDSQ